MKAGHVGHVVSLGTTPDHSPDEKHRASAVLRFDERRYPKKSQFVSNYVDWMTYEETAGIGIASVGCCTTRDGSLGGNKYYCIAPQEPTPHPRGDTVPRLNLKQALTAACRPAGGPDGRPGRYNLDLLPKPERDFIYGVLLLDPSLGFTDPGQAIRNVVEVLDRAETLLEHEYEVDDAAG